MTAPAEHRITAAEWSRITSALGLAPDAAPADVIAALDRRKAGKRPADIERETRAAAVRRCRRCGPTGWRLGPDGVPVDPAVRCDHGAVPPPPAGRDITEPLHRAPDTAR